MFCCSPAYPLFTVTSSHFCYVMSIEAKDVVLRNLRNSLNAVNVSFSAVPVLCICVSSKAPQLSLDGSGMALPSGHVCSAAFSASSIHTRSLSAIHSVTFSHTLVAAFSPSCVPLVLGHPFSKLFTVSAPDICYSNRSFDFKRNTLYSEFDSALARARCLD